MDRQTGDTQRERRKQSTMLEKELEAARLRPSRLPPPACQLLTRFSVVSPTRDSIKQTHVSSKHFAQQQSRKL